MHQALALGHKYTREEGYLHLGKLHSNYQDVVARTAVHLVSVQPETFFDCKPVSCDDVPYVNDKFHAPKVQVQYSVFTMTQQVEKNRTLKLSKHYFKDVSCSIW